MKKRNKNKSLEWLYYIALAVGLFAAAILLYGIIQSLLS